MKRTFALSALLAAGLSATVMTASAQRNFADVQKKFEPKQAQLKALNDDVENLKKQLQTQGDKLSPAEQTAKTKKIDEETKELQRSAEDARNDYQSAVGDMYNSLASKVYEVVEAYAKEQGYTLVIDVSQQQSPVLYAAESTNITQAVIAGYNTKSGVPAPPPSAPSAPAAPKPAPKAPAAAPKQ